MDLPADFISYTRNLMGEELYSALEKGLSEPSPVSIRLNPFKVKNKPFIPLKDCDVPWCKNGIYLKKRPNFTFDPLLHSGAYYVQEASSMFLDHVLRILVDSPVTMLDLCAAPGGKSTCAISALPEGSKLWSNEPMKNRISILYENILKYGNSNITVTNCYARDYMRSKMKFDIILTDVPCSGEGMFRKDEGAIGEWSLENVSKCQKLQREIVSDIWSCLVPGGYLIYSTCTFNAHEDEENVDWIAKELGADFVEIPIKEEWNITGSLIDKNPVYRFLPGKTRGEGLFMAVLKKNGEKENIKRQGNILPYRFFKKKDEKKKDLIPVQAEVLSADFDRTKYKEVEINYRQAIDYLRKEAITLPAETSKGQILLTYKNIPLGLAKNIGNRANNLYPAEWKIKSSHIPENNNTVIE